MELIKEISHDSRNELLDNYLYNKFCVLNTSGDFVKKNKIMRHKG